MGLFGDLLDLIGLGGITGIDILFAVMAIIGTGLFLIYFILVMLFGFADDMFRDDRCIDFQTHDRKGAPLCSLREACIDRKG